MKRQLEDLQSWLGREPYCVVSHRQLARLLKERATDRFPNHGLVSYALRECYPVSQEFVERVARLHSYVKAHLGQAELVEFVGSRFVVPPYCPSSSLRFHSGELKNPGDVLLSEDTLGGALAVLPADMVGFCKICQVPIIKRSWNQVYCSLGCRKEAHRRRRRKG